MRAFEEFHVRKLDEVSSTNDVVKYALAAGEAEGLVVQARRQTDGYGRQGHTWISPEGGLYLSALFRPQVSPDALPTLSLAVAIAVRRALVSFVSASAAEAIQLKWPNDVVVLQTSQSQQRTFHKLCGISLEAVGSNGYDSGVCIGIGVNVAFSGVRLDAEGKNAPAYLADLDPHTENLSVDAVCDAVLTHLLPAYTGWHANGFAPLLVEYNCHAVLTGSQVRVENRIGDLIAQGTVRTVDEQGRLVLVDESGVETSLSTGEVHLV